jgi:hypothetical protein
MRHRQLILLGIVAFASSAPAVAYADGNAGVVEEMLNVYSVVVAIGSVVTVTGVWLAAAYNRVAKWLAVAWTITALGLSTAMACLWADMAWLVGAAWAAMVWGFAAATIVRRARRTRRSQIVALPMARVVQKERGR